MKVSRDSAIVILALTFSVLMGNLPAFADEAANNNAESSSSAQVEAGEGNVPEFQLERASTFAYSAKRSPFWPIGWEPGQEEVEEKKKSFTPTDYFEVSSVLLGDTPLAVVKTNVKPRGGHYTIGERVPFDFDGQRLEVTMKKIVDGGCQFQIGRQTFWIRLNRGDAGVGQPEPVE